MSTPLPRPASAPVAFLPRLAVEDPLAAHWLRQVTIRLRREVCWLWRERSLLAGTPLERGAGLLPPFVDRLGGVLDLARYDEEKRAFFVEDTTAAYLSDLLAAPPPVGLAEPARGGFGWVVRELEMEPVERFALALALSATVDSAAATVFAACLNEPHSTRPTLGLAQRLWDAPEEVLAIVDPSHRLGRYGLLASPPARWEEPLSVPAPVARELLFPGGAPPPALAPLPEPAEGMESAELERVAARLRTASGDRALLLPLIGEAGAPLAAAAAAVAAAIGGRGVMPGPGARPIDVGPLATLAWLRGLALHLPAAFLAGEGREGHDAPLAPPLPALPVVLLVGMEERADVKRLGGGHVLPPLALPPLGYRGRLDRWRAGLGGLRTDPALEGAVADCARRFRYEAPAIDRVCEALRALGRPPRPDDLLAACRADVDLGELAQPVAPRFALPELMLPAHQTRQIEELIRAVRSLTTVHHEWGTARAWSESGLSALFAGPPGTGKTMAAEVVAAEVGMPLFRIDLSQVVNKYIGETEKNLRRLFDAADAADVVLFFDEADALFGKRTEVKDAHDRYANLEVSYLLERMERFKGLAILATNRKKDLDEAFLRRLRFLVEFPLPGAEERRRIWRGVVPEGVDTDALDLDFLAERFPLAGGHIRAIVFQACLQSATASGPRRLEMPAVVRAVRREMEKLGRAISLEQFGAYAALTEE